MNDIVKTPFGDIHHVNELGTDLIERHRSDPKEFLGFKAQRWPAFTEFVGGFVPRTVNTITADTGQGKTTFAVNWMMDAVCQRIPSLLVSLEESWADMAETLGMMISEKPITKMKPEDVGAVLEVFSGMTLWYFDHTGRVLQNKLFEAIRTAVEKHGVRFVLIDNMDYIIRNQKSDTEASAIHDFMCDISALSKTLQVAIVIIVHPSKLGDKSKQKRPYREINMDEMKGSSSIKQESNNVFSLFRPRPNSNEMALKLCKCRSKHYSKYVNAFVRFALDPSSLWFRELSPYPEWGDFNDDGYFEPYEGGRK